MATIMTIGIYIHRVLEIDGTLHPILWFCW